MKPYKIALVVLLGAALFSTGCFKKKSAEQANLSGTGFESVSSNEELAQLPQAANSNQQASVEVLPIETSPVTQGTGTASQTTAAAPSSSQDASSLSRDKQIQTALKNAGFYQGKIDGIIGPISIKAIQAFQKSHGLSADGKVGPKTWAQLEPFLTS